MFLWTWRKLFDRVPRQAIGRALRSQLVSERLIDQVMALYAQSTSKAKTSVRKSDSFDIKVGVHQGSASSPLLFIVVTQEAAKERENTNI